MEEIERTSLLDDLTRRAGCRYISDLRDAACHGRLRRVVEQIPAEDFPLGHWLEAARYLGTEEASAACESAEAARAHLLRICAGE